MLEVVRHRHQAGRPVVERDRHVLGAEDLADLVADEIDDRLEIELRGEPLLHAVDDRELGRALLALLEQALRLVEEPRVLERDAHACRDGAEQPHLGFAEGVLALDSSPEMIVPSTRSLPRMGTLTERKAWIGSRNVPDALSASVRAIVRDDDGWRVSTIADHVACPDRAVIGAMSSRLPCSYS